MNKSFGDKVYDALRAVPRGRVITYGQLAAMAESPKAARAVGMLMRNNPDAPATPCHRVVASDGRLVGYSGEGGVAKKREMLIKEGVIFKGDKVDLTSSRWQNY